MAASRRTLGTYLLLVVVLAATIGCDRVTKRIAADTLMGTGDRSFLAGTVTVLYAENSGGFLSLGAGLPLPGRNAVFVVGTGLILVGMTIGLLRSRFDWWSMLGVTLFVAGGASNWIDRVTRGTVVDFLNIGIGRVRTGVFNVADVAIMAGLALLVVAEARSIGARDR